MNQANLTIGSGQDTQSFFVLALGFDNLLEAERYNNQRVQIPAPIMFHPILGGNNKGYIPRVGTAYEGWHTDNIVEEFQGREESYVKYSRMIQSRTKPLSVGVFHIGIMVDGVRHVLCEDEKIRCATAWRSNNPDNTKQQTMVAKGAQGVKIFVGKEGLGVIFFVHNGLEHVFAMSFRIRDRKMNCDDIVQVTLDRIVGSSGEEIASDDPCLQEVISRARKTFYSSIKL